MNGPFEQALGPAMKRLAPNVGDHLSVRSGRRVYAGTMTEVWRRPGWRGWLALPFLYLAARAETLFPETGHNIPFTLENVCRQNPDGAWMMTWTRQFLFPRKTRRFDATMYFDHKRGTLIDLLGSRGRHEVELYPRTDNGVFRMVSGRQWLHTPIGRVRLPAFITGQAEVVERELDNGQLGVAVTIRNPLLGPFFGYEGVFRQKDESSLPVYTGVNKCHNTGTPERKTEIRRRQPVLVLLVFLATAAYAGSFSYLPNESSLNLPRIATIVAIAAALAWPLLGAALTAFRRDWGIAALMENTTLCLETMLRGNLVLGLSILLNIALVPAPFAADSLWMIHGFILILANLSMARYFLANAKRLCVSMRTGLSLWVFALNAPFLLIVSVLWIFI